MKLVNYILIMAVLFSGLYCSGFCFFYGMSTEDGVFMFLSAFFAAITYFWYISMKPQEHEYTKKIIELLSQLKEE